MTQDGHMGVSSHLRTTLYGGGLSVVGNTTIGFCVTTAMGAAIAAGFIVAGQPGYALAGFALPYIPFLVYFFATLSHVAKNPDAAVTSEQHYARVVEFRTLAAKDASIVRPGTSIAGGSTRVVEAIANRAKDGLENV